MGNNQSIVPDGVIYGVAGPPAASGETGAYRHPKFVNELLVTNEKRGPTMATNWQNGLAAGLDGNCIGQRIIDKDGNAGEFEFLSYNDVNERAINFAHGLRSLKLAAPNSEDGLRKVGFFTKNKMEWVIIQIACHIDNVIVVPLYDTLGTDSLVHSLNLCDIETVVCSSKEIEHLNSVKDKVPSLKHIIHLRGAHTSDTDDTAAASSMLQVFTVVDVETDGKFARNNQMLTVPKPNDIALISFTSGTTGDPKGVVITHKNIMSEICAAEAADMKVDIDTVHLSFLPLAHMFEQIIHVGILGVGGCIAFYQGNPLNLIDDLLHARPTLFCAVPRVFNRIHDKIMGGVDTSGIIAKTLFKTAYEAKRFYLAQGYLTHAFWDNIMFNKISAKVGLDRCQFIVTGAAPLAGHVLEFLRIVFSCPVREGYGQSECAGACTLTPLNDFSTGHVGGPLPCSELKLVDVPEMDYLSADSPCPRGEICIRGPNVFPHYFKNASKTEEVLDKDGWLRTGDIGLFHGNGSLKIVDRRKNIFKLAQGEYIAPEKIENIYTKSRLVAQAFIYGDSLQSCLVAIIVPDKDQFERWAAEQEGISCDSSSIYTNEDLKTRMLCSLNEMARNDGLKGFELAHAFHLEQTPWTPEEEKSILTPTFKLQRKPAQMRYQKEINDMYSTFVVAGKTGLKQGVH